MNTYSKIQNFLQNIVYMAKTRPYLLCLDCTVITIATIAYCALFVNSYTSYTLCVLMALIFAFCLDAIAAYTYWRIKFGFRF